MAAAPTAADVRARIVNGLFPPVREIVLAMDEIKAAWAERDPLRMDAAIALANRRVAAYLERLQS